MTYDMTILDNAISEELRNRVWQYLYHSRWYTAWKPMSRVNYASYVPAIDTDFAHFKAMARPNFSTWQHRATFASDEESLKSHPVIFELWQAINSALGNQFEITGVPEGMPVDPTDTERETPPQTVDTNLPQGWRVYANGQTDETQKRTHGVHRDNPFVNEDKYWSILFCANPKWFPTWFGDCIYYPDDVEGVTGDRQQYQNIKGLSNQGRDFPVGWANKIVSPVPGRIIAYDGRTLHTTHPTAAWCPVHRRVVAFRVSKKQTT